MNRCVAALVVAWLALPAQADPFKAERDRAAALGFEQKLDEYEAALRALAKKGDVLSQISLGRLAVRKGKFAEAEQWLLPPAKKGEASAQFHLGALYAFSMKRDAEGRQWLEKSAANGSARARYLLDTWDKEPSMPLAPEPIGGKLATGEMVDISWGLLKHSLRSIEGMAACYKTAPQDIDKVFAPARDSCKAAALEEYGPAFPEAQEREARQAILACFRTEMLAIRGITPQELVACSRQFR